MSEAAAETGPEVVELPSGDAAFGALMDALAPEPDGEAPAGDAAAADAASSTAGAGAAEAGPAAAADTGAPAAPADGSAAAAAAPDAKPGEPAAGVAQPEAGAGGVGTAEPGTVVTQLGDLSNKIEEKVAQQHHDAALAEVRTEHAQYFAALEKHPRLLVGTQVPRVNGEGLETLKSAEDAKDWQDAIKSLLSEEVRDRATKAIETQTSFLETVNNAVKMFQDNPDLIPGTKGFDKELADKFATLAKPYEVRVEEKLRGYAIPVQPLIDSLRNTLVTERSNKAATPPAAAAQPAAAAKAPASPAPPKPEDLPQAGIENKAGSGGGETEEEFSTLFATIGLPNFRI